MGRKRNMPSRKKIFEYWKDKLDWIIDDNTCFNCGYTHNKHTAVDRAHIVSVFNGGSDSPSNIHLLCNKCHKISEPWEGEIYNYWFYNNFINDCHFILSLHADMYFGNITIPDSYRKYFDLAEQSSWHKTKKEKEDFYKTCVIPFENRKDLQASICNLVSI